MKYLIFLILTSLLLFFQSFSQSEQPDNKCIQTFKTAMLDTNSSFPNGLAIFRDVNGKMGLVNAEDKVVLSAQFDQIYDFINSNIAKVRIGQKYGLINPKGEIVIDPQFDWIYKFINNNVAKVRIGQKYGLINPKGEIVIDPQFDTIDDFFHDVTPFKLDEKWGLINIKGEIVLPAQFYMITNFLPNGLALVRIEDGLWGLINTEGKIVLPVNFDVIRGFVNGFSQIIKDKKIGFINEAGEIVIPLQFDWADDFSPEGLALVKMNKESRWIDTEGNFVIPVNKFPSLLDKIKRKIESLLNK